MHTSSTLCFGGVCFGGAIMLNLCMSSLTHTLAAHQPTHSQASYRITGPSHKRPTDLGTAILPSSFKNELLSFLREEWNSDEYASHLKNYDLMLQQLKSFYVLRFIFYGLWNLSDINEARLHLFLKLYAPKCINQRHKVSLPNCQLNDLVYMKNTNTRKERFVNCRPNGLDLSNW